ncbi:2'-5' RNA ligase family protein [Piscinibacter terrae]|uniref:RNA 2',3'-cyclic phosphodiesterase n=1 Tax=Piscinibacter terrae TaxID=2496871 RepID=A0A3N7HLD6_9BURK|nr:2'-5' RNA ligase family protein [Albitalea terrae]RQP22938.1 RNA 2',3'-cyclic phosphodiesterase [Albitalea terrae]
MAELNWGHSPQMPLRQFSEICVQQSLLGFEWDKSAFGIDNLDRRVNKPQPFTLFFAIFPEHEHAKRLALASQALRAEHHFEGRLITVDRLHVSLHSVGKFIDMVPRLVVDAAMAAAARVDCPQFTVVFDHVQSFPPSNAFVLIPDAKSDAAIARLRQLLAIALRKVSLHPQASRTAHMTMLYDKEHIAMHPIEGIEWKATRFALILSHEGQTHHQWVGEWALSEAF